MSQGPPIRLIRKAGAVIVEGGRLLAVRKRSDASHTWMLPGGKPEPGETDLDALHREVREELGAEVAQATWFGRYEGRSALEDALIRMEIYAVVLDAPPRASSEIAELRWIDCEGADAGLALGGALRDHVMPRLAANAAPTPPA